MSIGLAPTKLDTYARHSMYVLRSEKKWSHKSSLLKHEWIFPLPVLLTEEKLQSTLSIKCQYLEKKSYRRSASPKLIQFLCNNQEALWDLRIVPFAWVCSRVTLSGIDSQIPHSLTSFKLGKFLSFSVTSVFLFVKWIW